MSVNEAIKAMELGIELVKLFPASNMGPSFIKNLRAPLPQLNIIPTGGINVHNAVEWFAAGAVAIGVGQGLASEVKGDDYASVTAKARQYCEIVASL
jgi:2-dehydro-3-deoxyphosphogluconate aldolase / (4S)-4-hydroxy-2-oxoglutarate aldolase